MTALSAYDPASIHATLATLRVAWWDRGSWCLAVHRWKTSDDIARALVEDDPWLRANAVRIVAELSPETALPLALDLVRDEWTKSDLDSLARSQALGALWVTGHLLSLDALLERDVSDHLTGVDVTKVVVRIPTDERSAAFASLLARSYAYGSIGYRVRELLALESIVERETIDALAAAVLDDTHPTQGRAAEWLYRGGSEPSLRALSAYLERGGERSEIRLASIGAAARLDAETASRLLALIAGDESAPASERTACFDAVALAIRERRVRRDDLGWIRLGLRAVAERDEAVVAAAKRMLRAMNKRSVERCRAEGET